MKLALRPRKRVGWDSKYTPQGNLLNFTVKDLEDGFNSAGKFGYKLDDFGAGKEYDPNLSYTEEEYIFFAKCFQGLSYKILEI